jgi:hypothetical protein
VNFEVIMSHLLAVYQPVSDQDGFCNSTPVPIFVPIRVYCCMLLLLQLLLLHLECVHMIIVSA